MTDGFIYKMSNGRGRFLIQEILRELIAKENTDRVEIFGGSGTHEPATRAMRFSYTYTEEETRSNSHTSSANFPSSDRYSPSKTLDISSTTPTRKSPRRSVPRDDTVTEQIEDEGVRTRTMVPDVLIERFSNDNDTEPLVVVVKSGSRLLLKDFNQLLLLLLPLLHTQGSALGLLICTKEDSLMKYTLNQNCTYMYASLLGKDYIFEKDNFQDLFIEMWRDIDYYVNQ